MTVSNSVASMSESARIDSLLDDLMPSDRPVEVKKRPVALGASPAAADPVPYGGPVSAHMLAEFLQNVNWKNAPDKIWPAPPATVEVPADLFGGEAATEEIPIAPGSLELGFFLKAVNWKNKSGFGALPTRTVAATVVVEQAPESSVENMFSAMSWE